MRAQRSLGAGSLWTPCPRGSCRSQASTGSIIARRPALALGTVPRPGRPGCSLPSPSGAERRWPPFSRGTAARTWPTCARGQLGWGSGHLARRPEGGVDAGPPQAWLLSWPLPPPLFSLALFLLVLGCLSQRHPLPLSVLFSSFLPISLFLSSLLSPLPLTLFGFTLCLLSPAFSLPPSLSLSPHTPLPSPHLCPHCPSSAVPYGSRVLSRQQDWEGLSY